MSLGDKLHVLWLAEPRGGAPQLCGTQEITSEPQMLYIELFALLDLGLL